MQRFLLINAGIVYSTIAPLVLVFCVVAFALFLAAFRYSFIYVSMPLHNCDGMFFPVALNQLFTGMYVMEACGLGLFLLARNEDHSFACIGQAVIVALALGATLVYQVFLHQAFSKPIQFLSVVPIEDEVSRYSGFLRRALRSFQNLLLEDAPCAEYEKPEVKLGRGGFDHEAIRASRPVVWIPQDPLGVSEDEIAEARSCYQGILMNNENAFLDEKGNLETFGDPPEVH